MNAINSYHKFNGKDNKQFSNEIYTYLHSLSTRGKYSTLRKALENENLTKKIDVNYIYGLLENIENNFNASLNYFNKCINDEFQQKKMLLSIAKIHLQLGDYKLSRIMLQTLLYMDKYKEQAKISLVNSYIITGELNKAKKIMNDINRRDLEPKQEKHYLQMLCYLNNNISLAPSLHNDYLLQRMFSDDNELAIDHIMKHYDESRKIIDGYFLKKIDPHDLFHLAEKKIEEMNPNHFEFSDMYRFRLNEPIGYMGEDLTSDMCVTTILGTKKIVTMYPVSLSYKFDDEGFSTSKELKEKRELGRR